MISRYEAEAIFRALTGGAFPEDQETVLFDPDIGWTFGQPIALGSDFFIHSPGWYMIDPIASSAAFGYRFIVNQGTSYVSFRVTYDPGGGTETYDFDISAPEIHTLFLTNGTTPFTTTNAQATFEISIIPYTGASATGTAGTEILINTGTSIQSGRGVTVEQQDATVLTGNLIRPGHPFEFNPDAGDEEPTLELSATYSAGNQTGTWAPDYKNGPTQKATVTGTLTINDITDFPDGGTMNIHLVRGGYTVTMSGTYFEGATLSFGAEDFIAISVVDFGRSKLVIGSMAYT